MEMKELTQIMPTFSIGEDIVTLLNQSSAPDLLQKRLSLS